GAPRREGEQGRGRARRRRRGGRGATGMCRRGGSWAVLARGFFFRSWDRVLHLFDSSAKRRLVSASRSRGGGALRPAVPFLQGGGFVHLLDVGVGDGLGDGAGGGGAAGAAGGLVARVGVPADAPVAVVAVAPAVTAVAAIAWGVAGRVGAGGGV